MLGISNTQISSSADSCMDCRLLEKPSRLNACVEDIVSAGIVSLPRLTDDATERAGIDGCCTVLGFVDHVI